MAHLQRTLAVALVTFVLAGCLAADASPTASSTPGTTDSAGSPAPAPTSAATTAATAEPVATDALTPFSCDEPLHSDATVGRANIVDVRIGSHDGYDRVVFEFTDGLPEAFVESAEPPFSQDGSGFPIEVEGSTFLRLTVRGGTKQMDDGSSSYPGPTEFEPDFPMLVHLVEGGDFEGQSTWYLGLAADTCVRVLTLTEDGPPRLVIDIEH